MLARVQKGKEPLLVKMQFSKATVEINMKIPQKIKNNHLI
jgi:hypothetical protein